VIAAAAEPVYDRTIIDYLRVTHDEGEFFRDVLRGPVEQLQHGVGMYGHAERDGHGTYFFAGGPEGGRFMLQMSGEPLEAWRETKSECELVDFLRTRGARCTRLDLARDTAGEWTPERLREFLDGDRYVTPWRKPPVYTQQRGGPLSVYMGSRKSEFMLRVYDKRGEQLGKERPCAHERLTRWEEEIKGELAAAAFRSLWIRVTVIAAATGEAEVHDPPPPSALHSKWLGKRLRLTSQRVDRKNRDQSRAPTDPAWSEFLSTAAGPDLVAADDVRTIERRAEDFARSFIKGYAGSVATFAQLAGEDGMAKLLMLGAVKRSAKHRLFVEHAERTAPIVRAQLGLGDDG
jgi:hypothetical protein